MADFFEAVKAGIRGMSEALGPGRFQAAGRPVACQHCRGEIFEKAEAQLNTAGASLLGMDWANRSGTALVCTECGLIAWFLKAPDRV